MKLGRSLEFHFVDGISNKWHFLSPSSPPASSQESPGCLTPAPHLASPQRDPQLSLFGASHGGKHFTYITPSKCTSSPADRWGDWGRLGKLLAEGHSRTQICLTWDSQLTTMFICRSKCCVCVSSKHPRFWWPFYYKANHRRLKIKMCLNAWIHQWYARYRT